MAIITKISAGMALCLALSIVPSVASAAAASYQHCIDKASRDFSVPSVVIESIIEVEGGKVGTKSKNSDGSYDYGIMQINTWWFRHGPLRKQYNVSIEEVTNNACINIYIGTWILATELANAKDFWTGIGNYNSNIKKKPRAHVIYKNKVRKVLVRKGAVK